MAKRQRQDDGPEEPQAPPPVEVATGLSLADLGVSDGVATSEAPRIREPRPGFVFLFHPERWFVSHGLVVPQLKRLVLQNALNGVRQGENGRFSITTALADQQKRGWRALDPLVDGKASYVYRAAEGIYLSRWETAHAGSSTVTGDGKGYAEWLRGLVTSGKLPPPAPYVLEQLKDRLLGRTRRLQDQVRTVPSVQVDLDAALASLTAVERELAGGPNPTPIPKGAENPLPLE